MTINRKAIIPHLIAIGVFLVVALVYCKPALEGKVLQQSDIIHWKGMAQSSFEYKETHGHFPLWTNSMFGGMPAYQIAIDAPNPIAIGYLHFLFTLFLPKPFSFFFLLCIGFYFLTQVFKVDYRIGILGSLAYAYASFSAIIVGVGHETQALAMGYMPALLGSINMVYKDRYIIGGTLTTVFASLMIGMNHPQISYYLILTALCLTIGYSIVWIKNKEFKHMFRSFVIVGVAALIGVAANMVSLATTYDYSKATMRGGTLNLDTSANTQQKEAGLPIDYAFQWSYGIPETFTLIVPDVYAGTSNSGNLDGKSHLAKMAVEKGIPDDQAVHFASQFPTYWGDQPFTSGPVYLGAIICFLFLFGLVYKKGIDKWWILAACILAIVMCWGKNFAAVNNLLFEYLPMYNKFRAPTMSLVIPQLLFPLLAVIALQKFIFDEKDKTYAWNKLKMAGYVTGGVFLVIAALYTSFSYKTPADANVINSLTQMTGGDKDTANSFYNALVQDRQSLLGADLIRSILFAGIAFACLWLFLKDKLKASYLVLALLFLSSIDLLAVSTRYLNSDSFQTKDDQDGTYFTPTAIDNEIDRDTGYYRVLNLATDFTNDAITSYFHNSVGGYHPAKLSIAEDLLNFQLRNKQPINIHVLNMLNTKYVIVPGEKNQPMLQQNPGSLGPCWLVQHIEFVNGAAAAMKALDNFNPQDTAIVEEDYKKLIPFMPVPDSTAFVKLIKNDNDVATYQSSSKTNQFAVFSEIYYDRGWKAYVDGKETPIVKTDYALRGLALPSGNHDIKFEFKPESYYFGVTASIAGSILAWLAIGASIFVVVRRRKAPVEKTAA